LRYTFVHSIEGVATAVIEDDDSAIAYALRAVQGGAIEIWRAERLVATIDETAPGEDQIAA
jgi:hypothetical protein